MKIRFSILKKKEAFQSGKTSSFDVLNALIATCKPFFLTFLIQLLLTIFYDR
ncbi:hypothetical protein [Fluviicola sp.]|uniref:hypothetical protein n=1 Tax=Fluviicola sp. TaxID=1917219 RepID=UPI002604C0ED|nr:hypothetical protein [Fluviicola sp.]